MPLHHPGQSLGPGGAVCSEREPSSWLCFLRWAITAVCFFIRKALGVMAASVKPLAFGRKLHHPEGSVSAFSDASVFRIVSSVHGVRQSLPILGSLLGSLRGSAGLHAGHGSGSEFSLLSWIRLRPYLHDWLIQASSRE